MIRVGDKKACVPTFAGEWKGYGKVPTGTVIQIYKRFAVVKFPSGYRECYQFSGPGCIR